MGIFWDSVPSEYCDSGLKHMNLGQYDCAIKKFTQGAYQNHAESQFNLAKIYKFGFGLECDQEIAMYWFKESLKNGYLEAGFFIGCTYYHGNKTIGKSYKEAYLYLKSVGGPWGAFASDFIGTMFFEGGYGIEKDYSRALAWFEKYSRALVEKHFYTIGVMYAEGGFGLQKDFKASATWFKRINSLVDYQSGVLGSLYFIGGYGLERDYHAALRYWSKNIESNGLENNLGILYTLRDDDEHDFIKAMSWFEKTDSYFLAAGIFYEKGLGVDKNDVKAMRFYEQAPNKQKQYALVRMGLLHQKGLGTPQDFQKAFECYETALEMEGNDADLGDAMACLGVLYQYGFGVTKSQSKAIEYFQKAVDLKSLYGYNCMGDAYKYGCGVDIDHKKAFQWYEKCVNCYDNTVRFWEKDFKLPLRFCDEGWLNIGIMYFHGLGTHIDKEVAWAYLKKASKFGNDAAQNYIDQIDNDPFVNTTTIQASNILIHAQNSEVQKANSPDNFSEVHTFSHTDDVDAAISRRQGTIDRMISLAEMKFDRNSPYQICILRPRKRWF
ncbi:uncharacterized protein EV154DRAFT_546691 [Mucor mucedo]|uniref:uncharacterized protein n=1 Tax=Mucor mucedo TaxID=29922 RepID=UPI00221F8066|nr:uncharacterized protein EV154DRAFT_546691 [Mucor mucedo]KAI7897279.1 hypothetical protein EV154DRAFT_546691 [Mucor mucedo]